MLGHAADFSWIAGRLERSLSCTYLRFGSPKHAPWGGRIALGATPDQVGRLPDGDTVVVKGDLKPLAYGTLRVAIVSHALDRRTLEEALYAARSSCIRDQMRRERSVVVLDVTSCALTMLLIEFVMLPSHLRHRRRGDSRAAFAAAMHIYRPFLVRPYQGSPCS